MKQSIPNTIYLNQPITIKQKKEEGIIIIGVYSITNLKTNKLYIGESLDIDKRWINHKNDLLNNQHANYYLQQDFNKFGKAFFKFEVLQEVERDSITITQSKLLMLENAYIEKYKKENYELYNIENTLEDVLSNKRKLLVCEEIANYVVVSQFLKNKYVYDHTNKRFNYCQRDTIENLILSNSSIKGKEKAKQVASIILKELINQNLYENFIVENTYSIYLYHKIQERKITEINSKGREYILSHYDFNSFLLRKRTSESKIHIQQYPSEKKIKPEDQNRIQDVWHGLKEKHILPPENKYNDFRDMLIKLNLIIIDNNKRTRATEFAMKNKYFLVVKYNKAKDIYQYVISQDGLKYISANIQ